MIMGGGPSDMHDQTGTTNTTAITDLSVANPAAVTAAPMAMRRMHLCATLLPDRTVLVNGGAMMEESRADATLEAEIYRPDFGGGAGIWAMAAKSRVARLYHSVALLVPDGRVITAGSNPARKTEELRIEVFWPPYLFAGPRPTCNPSATEVSYGGSVPAAVETAQIASACLIRPGATTHSLNSEQRLVDLPIQGTGPEAVLLQMPGTATIAPPGGTCCTWSPQRGFPPKAAGSTSPKRRVQAYNHAIEVTANGTLVLAYYDDRNNVLGDGVVTTDIWLRHSHNGGASWEPEQHLHGPFDRYKAPTSFFAPGDPRGLFLGDYIGLETTRDDNVIAFFASTLTDGADVHSILLSHPSPTP